MNTRHPLTAVLLLSALLPACSSSIQPTKQDDVSESGEDDATHVDDPKLTSGNSIPAQSGNFTHQVSTNGSVITTVVDASEHDSFQFLDLDTGEANQDTWDLKFSRFFILSNGGASGTGGVKLALSDADFDALSDVPSVDWTVDNPDGEDSDEHPDNLFNNDDGAWYDYDSSSHTLTPKDLTYVVQSSSGRVFKLRILDYYDEAGSPAIIRFEWAELGVVTPVEVTPEPKPEPEPEPEPTYPEGAIRVDASNADEWVYVNLANGLIDISDPETNLDWDVAFSRTAVRTNGGTSGLGQGAARASDMTFEGITSTSPCAFSEDSVETSPVPGSNPTSVSTALSDWYDYDPVTHSVSAGERAYLIRTADGSFAKLQVWNWEDGILWLSLEEVETDWTPVEFVLPEVEAGNWLYVDVSQCTLVTPASPDTDLDWDVAFSRFQAKTNSGTSGSGEGGAYTINLQELSGHLSAPSETFVVDTESGEPPLTGNAALNAWYNYNPATHALTPKDEVYWLKTTEGDYGLLEVESYGAGSLTVSIAFAGQGATTWGGAL